MATSALPPIPARLLRATQGIAITVREIITGAIRIAIRTTAVDPRIRTPVVVHTHVEDIPAEGMAAGVRIDPSGKR